MPINCSTGSRVSAHLAFGLYRSTYAEDSHYFTQTAIGLVMKLYEAEGIDANLMQHEDRV